MFSTAQLEPGRTDPLGAHWDGAGIHFALAAPNAEAVELCLFDQHGTEEQQRLFMPRCDNGIWHGYLKEAQPGLIYGYRVHGPYAPEHGQRFNPNKLLLDPYARLVVGQYGGEEAFNGHDTLDPSRPDTVDNAAVALKARVVHESYDWERDAAPRIPLAETILYELHPKGFTKLNPKIPEELRGSYAGLAASATLDYLEQLGITTVSLLPIHHRADEVRLQKMGLSNYWGYSSIGYFAPESRYWSGRTGTSPISEFRDMVKALHGRGIEVVLDVVYNHSAETDESGPTLSFRGIDNALYYRLRSDNPALYENWTGCGNCLNLTEPLVLQMVMDSLRYWVQEMHVDGFRFDLAPILARDPQEFSATSAFLAAVRQDPVLSRVKLIAEPWDIGPKGYQLGHFPPGWLEWNDRYRDAMRGFWLHHEATHRPRLGDLAQRFAASSDVFKQHHRAPAASVNFITAHDGFTLHDLVSYNHKHNEANGEHNRDGHHHNHHWNCGAEGPTDDAAIKQLRARLKQALLATLLFSQGTPMLLAGDEIGHSQEGNNNAYCQDNALCWLNWQNADLDLAAYVGKLIALRKRYPALRHPDWYQGQTTPGGHADIVWLTSDGNPMNQSDWEHKNQHCIAIHMASGTKSEACLLLINPEAQERHFVLPVLPSGRWQLQLQSDDPAARSKALEQSVILPAQALWLAVSSEHA